MTTSSATNVFYFDSSALVKRYVAEIGSNWVINLCDLPTNTIATVQVTKVEAAAAFSSKYRSGDLPQEDYTATLQDLNFDFLHQYFLLDINQTLIDLAVGLTQRQRLRGYDAVQLAAALILNSMLAQNQSSLITFVAADADLLQAAQNENLLVENPNLQS